MGFRDPRGRPCKKLTKRNDLIVSWGGGVILRELNLAALTQAGKIVWLHARPETLLERIELRPHHRAGPEPHRRWRHRGDQTTAARARVLYAGRRGLDHRRR